ncbi:PepSY-associated TM helix domain-containing protein [Fulvivirga lutimaris]|uniref:PepSY-associated TM helix domain-containing protein n=1 Tax=Fulvivirga lutimaris TaxID=1819566 RepID=UPI0012BBCD3E|nr:PepSY-associated TM helix domain-containing protein [Fulvivirga lutimaris]MTI38358.1 PepSY domain-containing protein [Fulvivirga lutimaris]
MERKKHASILRSTRSIHRKTGIILFVAFFAVAITGLMLGWKKKVDVLQHPTAKGSSKNLSEWLPMDTLVALAHNEMKARNGADISLELSKVDARPDKGIVKVIYENHYNSVQLDAVTGEVLSYEFRTSDLVEHLHEGTIIDNYFGLPNGIFKLFYTTVLGMALMTFTITGFWLWYGPKVMRKRN